MKNINHRIGLVIAMLGLVGCLGANCNGRVIAKSVNEAARAACESAFGEEPPPDGITVEEICQEHERLKPFIDAILGARQEVADGLEAPESE